MSSSGPVPMALNSGHSHQGQAAHSRLSERDSRPPISAKSDNNDGLEARPRDRDLNLRELQQWTGLPQSTTVIFPTHLPQSTTLIFPSLPIPEPQALAREVDVHVSTISPAQQSHSETNVHPGG